MNRRLTCLLGLTTLPACTIGGPGGVLRVESLGADPVYLATAYRTAYFAEHEATETSFFAADVALDDLLRGEVTDGNVVHLDLLWYPKAGSTPMDSSATNLSIRFVVFAGGEVGLYGGAGFGVPEGSPASDRMSLLIRDASLTLLDSTDGFVDLLSPARLTGQVTAQRSERVTRQMRFAVSQLVTDALGYSRFVLAEPQRGLEALTWLSRASSSGTSAPSWPGSSWSGSSSSESSWPRASSAASTSSGR